MQRSARSQTEGLSAEEYKTKLEFFEIVSDSGVIGTQMEARDLLKCVRKIYKNQQISIARNINIGLGILRIAALRHLMELGVENQYGSQDPLTEFVSAQPEGSSHFRQPTASSASRIAARASSKKAPVAKKKGKEKFIANFKEKDEAAMKKASAKYMTAAGTSSTTSSGQRNLEGPGHTTNILDNWALNVLSNEWLGKNMPVLQLRDLEFLQNTSLTEFRNEADHRDFIYLAKLLEEEDELVAKYDRIFTVVVGCGIVEAARRKAEEGEVSEGMLKGIGFGGLTFDESEEEGEEDINIGDGAEGGGGFGGSNAGESKYRY